jgi:hypothetical protein
MELKIEIEQNQLGYGNHKDSDKLSWIFLVRLAWRNRGVYDIR